MSDIPSRMNVARGLGEYQSRPYPVVTIGNFDGLHGGHMALLEATVSTARQNGGTATVLTFNPHPLAVLSPATPLRLLLSMEEKLARFEQLGIQQVLSLPFDAAFAALTPEEFVIKVLRDTMGVRELFVGEHFAFGARRSGHVADLVRLSGPGGFVVHPMPPVRVDGQVVSSTTIRRLIQAGDVRTAARLLGRAYEVRGVVVPGEGRGQDLGCPTANLHLPAHRVIPADGVYATMTVWKTRTLQSVSYIGTRPTFGPGERLLEVYVLDEKMDLYGEEIHVRFIDRLRDDLTFRTPEELAVRIGLDVTHARETLNAMSGTAPEER